jgi:hypothetical protein
MSTADETHHWTDKPICHGVIGGSVRNVSRGNNKDRRGLRGTPTHGSDCAAQAAKSASSRCIIRAPVDAADIATAFEAGANAYFAEAAISREFLQAINLITR